MNVLENKADFVELKQRAWGEGPSGSFMNKMNGNGLVEFIDELGMKFICGFGAGK